MTLRPSSVSAATGVTSTSASGRPAQVAQPAVGVADDDDGVGGAPARADPASRTAAAAVVPAATRIGAAGAGLGAALIGHSLRFRGC